MAVVLEIGPKESIGFAIEGSYILKASHARNLLCKDAMQLGVDAMRLDRYGNKPAHRFLNRLRRDLRQRATDDLMILIATIDDGGNERLLARKILVKRTDADPGQFSDPVGAGPVETFPDQNASGRFNKRLNGRT